MGDLIWHLEGDLTAEILLAVIDRLDISNKVRVTSLSTTVKRLNLSYEPFRSQVADYSSSPLELFVFTTAVVLRTNAMTLMIHPLGVSIWLSAQKTMMRLRNDGRTIEIGSPKVVLTEYRC